jgi:hypothetical protein
MLSSCPSRKSNAKKRWSIVVTIWLTMSLFVFQLLTLLPGRKTAVAEGASYTVCPAGPPTCDYATIQDAIDAAQPGDTVKVAAGVYNQVNNYGDTPQVVYLDKSVQLKGGYTTAFAEPADPAGNPTIIDAQQQGRGIYITGDITSLVEGFQITGGEMTLAANLYGGGVYVVTATATLRHNQIHNNVAGHGAGIALKNSSANLIQNVVLSNTAGSSAGGIHLADSPAMLAGNQISHNSAAVAGGGILLWFSDALIEDNIVSENVIVFDSNSRGAGLYLGFSQAQLKNNVIESNNAPGSSSGGGLHLFNSQALVQNNRIAHNSAGFGSGGGLFIQHSNATVEGNTVISNSAGYGGGALLLTSDAALYANTFLYNQATFVNGGGLALASGSNAHLVNNIIALNQAGGSGGAGISVSNSSPQFIHTTIAGNEGGDGSGIYVFSSPGHVSDVSLTNTILVGHSTGIYVREGNSATLTATLWGSDQWANGTNWNGPGDIATGAINISGDPAFVNAAGGDFHIGATSAAVNAGVDAGVRVDIDGEPRPRGDGFDMGADEYWPAQAWLVYLPYVAR